MRAARRVEGELPPEDPRIEPRALPCPFCGGPVTIMAWYGGEATRTTKTSLQCEDEDGKSCPVGPDVVGDTVEEALSLWNTRAARR